MFLLCVNLYYLEVDPAVCLQLFVTVNNHFSSEDKNKLTNGNTSIDATEGKTLPSAGKHVLSQFSEILIVY
jgi:hypothetical protein